jgi:glycerol-3-phosphate dehydrogenase (NAD(P)+)
MPEELWDMMKNKEVALLGAGAWGTAIAQLLAHNGYTVRLWCHDPDVAEAIARDGENKKYLPGILLDEKIIPTTDLAQAICGVRLIFEAIPVAYLRGVLEHARACATEDQVWVVLSKGIENKTLLFPTQIIDEVFHLPIKKAVFAGPSFAREVAEGAITGVAIGATDGDLGQELQQMLTNEYFRAYTTTDVMGVQVGAALKNVISIGIGILEGAGYGDNPKAFLLTCGLQEMVQLAQAMGGKQETLYGFSGVGDLILTSMGKGSRNREVGRRIGQGESLDAIFSGIAWVAEGINTLKSVVDLAQKHTVQVPICSGVYDVVFGRATVADMMQGIMKFVK